MSEKTLGTRAKALRKEKKLTLEELEKRSTIDKAVISRIENDLIDPKLSTATRLARGLRCSLDELVRGLYSRAA